MPTEPISTLTVDLIDASNKTYLALQKPENADLMKEFIEYPMFRWTLLLVKLVPNYEIWCRYVGIIADSGVANADQWDVVCTTVQHRLVRRN